MSTNIYINGVLVENIYGAKGASTAAATNIKSNEVDLNQSILALADGQTGPVSNVQSNAKDLNTFFGIPLTSLPINGKSYSVSAIFPSASTGSIFFAFTLTSTTAWATTVSRAGTTSGTPPAGNIDTGTIPTGATQVRYTPTWNNATGDTGAANTVNNNAATATALAANVQMGIILNGTGTSNRQTTYNFKVEFLNSSGVVISTTNFTVQELCEGTA